MKKEVILAIVIGFALGLVITFGIWTANKSLKALPTSKQASPTPEIVVATPTTSDTSTAISLSLTTPADESLVNSNKVTVSGKTLAGATIVIIDEDNQQIITADDQGNFSKEVNLIAGYNEIRITAYDKNGNKAEQSVVVTYTSAKI